MCSPLPRTTRTTRPLRRYRSSLLHARLKHLSITWGTADRCYVQRIYIRCTQEHRIDLYLPEPSITGVPSGFPDLLTEPTGAIDLTIGEGTSSGWITGWNGT